jgi:hypothetical protein
VAHTIKNWVTFVDSFGNDLLIFIMFTGGPGVYEVIKCGSFGHNIRNRPNLKATPVGRVTMGNQVSVIEEVSF